MKQIFLLAALLAPALAGSVALAGGVTANANANVTADPALVQDSEKYLRDDEKALLAAVLTHPDAAAQFNAQESATQNDPKFRKLFLDAWRGKIEAFAESDVKHPVPNLDAKYANTDQLMTPEMHAYMDRRRPTMDPDDRKSLDEHLDALNRTLQAKNGSLPWLSKVVVKVLMDHYRQDLTAYVNSPMGQDAKRNGPAAAKALAQAQQAPAPAAVATTSPALVPGATGANGAMVTDAPAGKALDQLNNAAANAQAAAGDSGGESAASRIGQTFDGGASGNDAAGGSVLMPLTGGTRPGSTLSSYTGPSGGSAQVPVPPPGKSGDDSAFGAKVKSYGPFFKGAYEKVRDGAISHMSEIAGTALGGIIGFLLGGPVGMIAGACLGYLAVKIGAHYLSK